MHISLIAAMSHRGSIIGSDGTLPWGKIPVDMKRFVALTMGNTVVMGRKTFESIGSPLKGRVNIVLSRSAQKQPRGVVYAQNKDDVMRLLRNCTAKRETFIIGGEEVYRLFIKEATRLYITLIHGTYSGDKFFPEIDMSQWSVVDYEEVGLKQSHIPVTFVTYQKY